MSTKAFATAQARAALRGVIATPSFNDRGERTLILSYANWVREIVPAQLAEALAELRQRRREGCVA